MKNGIFKSYQEAQEYSARMLEKNRGKELPPVGLVMAGGLFIGSWYLIYRLSPVAFMLAILFFVVAGLSVPLSKVSEE